MQTSETETTPGISEYKIGVVDSRSVAQMIDFIEREFGVYVSKHEIGEENLGSLRPIARFVASKQPFAVG